MGVTTEKARTYTVDEYLEAEQRTGERHEFYNGKIKLMAGGTIAHNRISRNVIQYLGNALDEKGDFEVFGSAQKIYLPDYHYYVYPDALVVADGPLMAEEEVLFRSVDVRLALSLIYRKVDFPAAR